MNAVNGPYQLCSRRCRCCRRCCRRRCRRRRQFAQNLCRVLGMVFRIKIQPEQEGCLDFERACLVFVLVDLTVLFGVQKNGPE